jgi:hypothetical protein
MNNELTQAVFGNKLDKKYTLSAVLTALNKMDLLNIGELAELAISKKSGIKKCSKMTENIDLESGYQIKHARTHMRPNGYWIATVSRNTTAPILLVISETKTKKQYFFHIPYTAHRHLSGNTIGISFGAHGWPSSGQWWAYEVESFEKLCELARNA